MHSTSMRVTEFIPKSLPKHYVHGQKSRKEIKTH